MSLGPHIFPMMKHSQSLTRNARFQGLVVTRPNPRSLFAIQTFIPREPKKCLGVVMVGTCRPFSLPLNWKKQE